MAILSKSEGLPVGAYAWALPYPKVSIFECERVRLQIDDSLKNSRDFEKGDFPDEASS